MRDRSTLLTASFSDAQDDAAQDLLDPRRWVTARWIKNDGPQELMVLISDDDVETWNAHRVNEANFLRRRLGDRSGRRRGRSIYHIDLYRGGAARLEFKPW